MSTGIWVDIKSHVVRNFNWLRDGETSSASLCPACDGGSTGERKFYVTREGTYLLYVCHRASCGIKGTTTSLGSGGRWIGEAREPDCLGVSFIPRRAGAACDTPRRYMTERYMLTEQELSRVCHGFYDVAYPGSNAPPRGQRDCPYMRTEVENGCVYRKVYPGAPGRKVFNIRRCQDGPPMYFASWGDWAAPSSVILVEDVLSAARASTYMPSVALLGTRISPYLYTSLREQRVGNILLCLDRDALSTAIAQARQMLGVVVVLLPSRQDIKDMPRDGLSSFFNTLQGDLANGDRSSICSTTKPAEL